MRGRADLGGAPARGAPPGHPALAAHRSLAALALLAALVCPRSLHAQLRASYSEGQDVSPAFEGWEENEDGSFSIVFGYLNRNWEQKLYLPVGEANHFSPGPADRGQPTYFLPRRNRFVFKVRVPADFGSQELVWTVVVNGSEQKAYGSLARDYRLDEMVVMSETGALGAGSSNEEVRSNRPPRVELEGDLNRAVRVGEPLTLAARVTDDGIPRRASAPNPNATPEQQLARALTPPRRITVAKTNGLHFTWLPYRGAGDRVAFEPAQVKTWEDTRAFANSPWAPFWTPPPIPEGNRWVTEVRFAEPGTYVLQGRADDGGLFTDVRVVVEVRP